MKGINTSSIKDLNSSSPKSRAKLQTNKPSPKFLRKSGLSNKEVKGENADVQSHRLRGDCLGWVQSDHKMHGREVINSENDSYNQNVGSENIQKSGKNPNMNVKSDNIPTKIRSGPSVTVKNSGSGNMSIRTQPAPPSTPGGPGSNIPKPTAHVKGTSKPTKEERNQVTSPMKPTVIKDVLPRQKQMCSRDGETVGNISVALVSPMPNVITGENSSSMSESSYSNSTGQSNSNSSDSSVIYRPSSESGSEVGKLTSRKIETTFDSLDKVILWFEFDNSLV